MCVFRMNEELLESELVHFMIDGSYSICVRPAKL